MRAMPKTASSVATKARRVPGSMPRAIVGVDRVRKELTFVIENDMRPGSPTEPRSESYGGLSIVRAMARLFGWSDLVCRADNGRFVVSWRVPAVDRTAGAD